MRAIPKSNSLLQSLCYQTPWGGSHPQGQSWGCWFSALPRALLFRGLFIPAHQGSRAGHQAHQGRHTQSPRSWQSRGGCSHHCSHHRHWSLGAKQENVCPGTKSSLPVRHFSRRQISRATLFPWTEGQEGYNHMSWSWTVLGWPPTLTSGKGAGLGPRSPPVCRWGETTMISMSPSTFANTVSLFRPEYLSTRWIDLVCQSVQ